MTSMDLNSKQFFYNDLKHFVLMGVCWMIQIPVVNTMQLKLADILGQTWNY